MNKYWLYILIIIFLFGCNDQVTSPEIGDSNSYFPLKKGNRWAFNLVGSDTIYSTARIIDQIIINSEEYYLFSFIEDTTQADTINIENNIIYRNRNKTKAKWLDFNLKKGESYKIGETLVEVETNVKVSTMIGEFSDCICFRFDDPSIFDDEVNYYFSKGVGLVKLETGWMILSLLEYDLK